jgi:CelD/BcsL family acetyltransferase involved in cellulose biosynthesis
MASPAQVRPVAGLAELEGVREAWHDLSLRRGGHRPFSGPGFALAVLAAFYGRDEAQAFLVERDGRLAGVILLVRRQLPWPFNAVREHGFPSNPHVLLNDPLLPENEESLAGTCDALVSALRQESWDTLVLDNMPAASRVPAAILAAGREIGFGSDGLEAGRKLCYISISGTFEDYLGSRSGDHRRQLKKIARRAHESGKVSVEQFVGKDAIAAALPLWLEIEGRSWQGASDERNREFARLLLAELRDDEVGELWVLRIGGEAASALRMLASPGRLSVHTMHYDQRFRDLSPGTIVFEAMLRSAWDRGLSEVDLHGDNAFFRRWATGHREYVSMRLYRPGLYGRGLRYARNAVAALRRTRNDPASARPD